jgi:D-psicose/D-tagatose/L-ribulose 3-epimerase
MKALKQSGYDGWCVIEAFGRALPDLAAATRVWRDFFANRDEGLPVWWEIPTRGMG